MNEQFYAWIIGLPLAVILGWFANRLFGPTADALGSSLLNWLSALMHRRGAGKDLYLKLEELMRRNHTAHGHRSFSERKTYLRDKDIHDIISNSNFFIKQAIKEAWIEDARIDSYNGSDMFFAAMELFLNELNRRDVQKIFNKYKNNDQAVLWPFLEFIEERRPKLLLDEAVVYLRKKQEEWRKQYDQQT